MPYSTSTVMYSNVIQFSNAGLVLIKLILTGEYFPATVSLHLDTDQLVLKVVQRKVRNASGHHKALSAVILLIVKSDAAVLVIV